MSSKNFKCPQMSSYCLKCLQMTIIFLFLAINWRHHIRIIAYFGFLTHFFRFHENERTSLGLKMMERAGRRVPLCFGTNGHIDRRKQGACKAGLLNHAASKKHNFRARITPPMFSLISVPASFPLILRSFELFVVEILLN